MHRRNALQKFATAALAPWAGVKAELSHAQQAPAMLQTTLKKEASDMLTRKIPSIGESLPVIGLGTWQTFDVGSDATSRAPLEEVMREFVALDGKVIDSSPM